MQEHAARATLVDAARVGLRKIIVFFVAARRMVGLDLQATASLALERLPLPPLSLSLFRYLLEAALIVTVGILLLYVVLVRRGPREISDRQVVSNEVLDSLILGIG